MRWWNGSSPRPGGRSGAGDRGPASAASARSSIRARRATTTPCSWPATDGVGTKLRIAIDTGTLDTIGIDLVAMCVNDLVCQGAEPLFFLDYLATGRLDVHQAARIVEGIAEGCRASGCALIGGEDGRDCRGCMRRATSTSRGSPWVRRSAGATLPQGVAEGDVLLGLASDGIHSNGFSLVRKVVEGAGLDLAAPSPFCEGALGAALLAPTRLYVAPCLAAIRAGGVHALAHITGGGLTENPPRVLPEGLGCAIDLSAWALPPVFRWLVEASGMTRDELLRTFNCGIGMVLVVDPAREGAITDLLRDAGETVAAIGRVVAGQGVAYEGHLA